MDRDTIRIIADDDDDDEESVEIRHALPTAHELGAIVHEVSGEVLQRNLVALLHRVETMFQSGTAAMSTFSVKEVTVKVAVNAAGEFSLLGVTKASADLHATFEITLIPKS
jgi:hypothetical protein